MFQKSLNIEPSEKDARRFNRVQFHKKQFHQLVLLVQFTEVRLFHPRFLIENILSAYFMNNYLCTHLGKRSKSVMTSFPKQNSKLRQLEHNFSAFLKQSKKTDI
jgi:hypothetical protein